MFLDEHEIIEDLLLYHMSESAKTALKTTSKLLLQTYHSGLTTSIIDYYELANVANPHTELNDPTANNHPDMMAWRILLSIWTRLNGK